MANNVMKILGKKGKLTGAEVGNLILKDMINQLLYSKSLITDAEAETAVNSLTDNEEIRIYNKRNALGHFICSIREKLLYAELLLSKTYLGLHTMTEEVIKALRFLEQPTPLKLTYAEYEIYKKEITKEYFKEHNRDVSLFEIVLKEIKPIYDYSIANGEELIESYKDHPLTEEEQAFYGEPQKIITVDYEAKTQETKAYLEKKNYKEAVICYLSDRHNKEETKVYDKGDIAYDLYEYWQESDKSPETFKKLIKDYEEILELSLACVSGKYFKDKYNETKLEELLNINYTLQALYEKHNYNLLPDILGKPILLVENTQEQSIEDVVKTTAQAFIKVFNNADLFKKPLETYEETIIAIENLNILLDLAKEETGLNEIDLLKCDTAKDREALQERYLKLCTLALNSTIDEKAEAYCIKKALENISNITVRIKNTPAENINKARELLKSSKKFKEYQADLFKLIAGVCNEW